MVWWAAMGPALCFCCQEKRVGIRQRSLALACWNGIAKSQILHPTASRTRTFARPDHLSLCLVGPKSSSLRTTYRLLIKVLNDFIEITHQQV